MYIICLWLLSYLLMSTPLLAMDYDPDNSIDITMLKNNVFNQSRLNSGNSPSTYIPSNKMMLDQSFLNHSNYDSYNAINSSQMRPQSNISNSLQRSYENFDSFISQKNQINDGPPPIADTTTDYQPEESINAQVLVNTFIPSSFSDSTNSKLPSILENLEDSNSNSEEISLDNATLYNQEDGLNTIQLEPFYNQ